MSGERISHYVVDRLIGVGGMGEVYLAEDETLHRKVALKILPERFTDDSGRIRRFQREARAASALNHPNIITIYEVGEDASRHFIATEYIEGKTLRERINSSEPLTLGEVLDISIGIASALTAAHEAGILHRDVKPENVMLRPDGYVKVLDFGLAKLIEGEEMKDSTTDAVMGTLRYLSPEQARGYAPDARSDIYSAGAVMYELLTREPPIMTDSFVELAIAITTRNAEPPSRRVPAVPPELDRIILKALQKDKAQRYETAREMADDLRALRHKLALANQLGTKTAVVEPGVVQALLPRRRLQTSPGLLKPFGTGVTMRQLSIIVLLLLLVSVGAFLVGRGVIFKPDPIESIVVLPFSNESSDENSEYLSDGIAESVTDSLSQIGRLHVIARSTAEKYRKKGVDPLVAGRDLHVRGVVTGEVMLHGDTLVVRAGLTDVEKGTQVWGQQYNRRLSDIFTIQQDIAENISNELKVKLTGEEMRRVTRTPTVNGAAYQAYLRGRYYYYNLYSEDSLRKAISYFQEAIRIEPGFAQAYAGVAEGYYFLSNVYMSPREAMPLARAAATKAVELDPSSAEAHAALALVRTWYDWDFKAGEEEFRRALALNPNDADAHRFYGEVLLATRQFDAALAEKKRAEQLDPLSVPASHDVARTYFYAGRYAEAQNHTKQRTLQLDPRCAPAYTMLANIAAAEGRYDDALAYIDKSIEFAGRKPTQISMWGYINAVSGHRDKALAAIQELKSLPTYTLPIFLARVNAGLGDNDETLRWLSMLYAERSESVVWLKVDPTLAKLRSDPRFVDLAKRIGV